MKVLFVTNMYPTEEHPYYGIFVKEQINAIKKEKTIESELFFIRGYKSSFEYLKSIFIINYKVLRFRPDVIHVHYGLAGLFLLLNPIYGKRTIITLHGGDINCAQGKKIQNFFTKILVRLVKKVYVMSEEMRDAAKSYSDNVQILPCGVDTDVFTCKNEEKDTDTKDITLVFPGDPERKVKDFPLFRKVLEILESKYESRVFRYKVVHNLDRYGVSELLCHADCMVMTSVSEGSPQIIKEAMACNLPIVSVNVGDVEKSITSTLNCYCSDTRSPEVLADLVGKVIENISMGSNGKEKLSEMGLENHIIAKKILMDYKMIMKGKM